MKFEIIKTIPHDKDSFTQGYFFKDSFLYESTGLYGRSSLRKINPIDGSVIKKVEIDKKYFAEGIEYYNNKIYMLTWRENVCKVFDFNNFNELEQFTYDGEGWGISLYENKFYMSNGSNTIKIIDPETFRVIDSFNLFDEKNRPLNKLNELQVFDEFLLANMWFTDKIFLIDLQNKKLIESIDFSVLRSRLKNQRSDVMNGIAYDCEQKLFYITGKFWDLCFKVKVSF